MENFILKQPTYQLYFASIFIKLDNSQHFKIRTTKVKAFTKNPDFWLLLKLTEVLVEQVTICLLDKALSPSPTCFTHDLHPCYYLKIKCLYKDTSESEKRSCD